MSRDPIGTIESVRKVDGETIATVRLGAPTDADVEALRRAMVEAHQTMLALRAAPIHGRDLVDGAQFDLECAVGAYVAAKRARGEL